MELGHHIDSARPLWCRCKSVKIDDDKLTYELSHAGWYGILDSYEDGPHLELLAANSDEAIGVFVRKWGPLRQLSERVEDSLSWYRSVRDLLTSIVRLIAATEKRTNQREELLTLIRLGESLYNPLPAFLRMRQGFEPFLDDPETWCENAPISEIDRLWVDFINHFPFVAGPRFVVEGRGQNRVVRAGLFVNNLVEALQWMIWQDVYRKVPFEFCAECGKLIHSDNRHIHKFCPGGVCARRKTDREHKRKARAAAKKQISARPGKTRKEPA